MNLTINISLCLITIVGGVTVSDVTIDIIQMLWANLMMDILGAIAIETEKYGDQMTHGINKQTPILLSQIWR